MRQREREKLCTLVAEWEFVDQGAVAVSGKKACADEIVQVFDLTVTDDLRLARFFKVVSLMQARGFPGRDDEEYPAWDEALEDLWDEVGYQGVVGLNEDGTLVERLRPVADHYHDIMLAQAGASL